MDVSRRTLRLDWLRESLLREGIKGHLRGPCDRRSAGGLKNPMYLIAVKSNPHPAKERIIEVTDQWELVKSFGIYLEGHRESVFSLYHPSAVNSVNSEGFVSAHGTQHEAHLWRKKLIEEKGWS